MRKVSLTLIVAALVVAASSTKPAAFEPGQDKAAEVLASVRQALGGGKLDSLKTFSMEAKTARNVGTRQMTSDVEFYLEMPDKYLRVENITAPMAASMSSGFNGDKVIRPAGNQMMGGGPMIFSTGPGHAGGGGGGGGMMVSTTTRVSAEMAAGGGSGNAALTPEQQAMMNAGMIRSQRVELSRYMLGWFGMAHPGLKATYSYVGEAESPDGKAHVIGIKADGGFEAKLFVDQATSIPLMLTYQGPEPRVVSNRGGGPGAPAGAPMVSSGSRGGATPPPPPPPGAAAPPAGGQAQMTAEEMQKMIDAARATPPKMIEYRIFFADWKEVDGIQFPHTMQRAVAGTTTEEWTIAKVKVNPKIDAKKFATQ
jgi:hypothetical protein